MASKKIGQLGSEIALIQHGFANESVAGLYDVCQTAFAKQCLGGKSRLSRHALE
jgi:hypothetical protein